MARIAEMHRRGMQPIEIARELGRDGRDINRSIHVMRKRGELPPPTKSIGNGRRLTEADRVRIVELSRQHSDVEIAAMVGCSLTTVQYWKSLSTVQPERTGGVAGHPPTATEQLRQAREQRRRENGPLDLERLRQLRQIPGVYFRTCQWIDGEPAADDNCKCRAPTEGGKAYCADHHVRAWQSNTSLQAYNAALNARKAERRKQMIFGSAA
ncbi:MAG TPA: helix-turn-helix domain-containing protein [Ramlibacter sp.]|nr:helix-turn-helix domain-containing protein [Ramlibacter sp.]